MSSISFSAGGVPDTCEQGKGTLYQVVLTRDTLSLGARPGTWTGRRGQGAPFQGAQFQGWLPAGVSAVPTGNGMVVFPTR